MSSINSLLKKRPISTPEADSFWPLPSQFIGLEIETEGMPRSRQAAHVSNNSPYWMTHQDSSLRNGGIEYVLAQPMMGKELRAAIHYFFETFSGWSTSSRTSTHVHLNMTQDEDTIEVLRAVVSLYFAIEPAVYKLVAGDRKWCSYCNTLDSNIPEYLTMLFAKNYDPVKWAKSISNYSNAPGTNTNRYYGLNLVALAKYGSLEFRHFPCTTSEDELTQWVLFVMELKKAAMDIVATGQTVIGYFDSHNKFLELSTRMPVWGPHILDTMPAHECVSRLKRLNAILLPYNIPQHVDFSENEAYRKYFETKDKPVPKKSDRPQRVYSQGFEDAAAPVGVSLNDVAERYYVRVGGTLAQPTQSMPPFADLTQRDLDEATITRRTTMRWVYRGQGQVHEWNIATGPSRLPTDLLLIRAIAKLSWERSSSGTISRLYSELQRLLGAGGVTWDAASSYFINLTMFQAASIAEALTQLFAGTRVSWSTDIKMLYLTSEQARPTVDHFDTDSTDEEFL